MGLSELLNWFKSKNNEKEEKASIENKLENQDSSDLSIKKTLDGYATKHKAAASSEERKYYDETATGFLNLVVKSNRERFEYITYYNGEKEKKQKPF